MDRSVLLVNQYFPPDTSASARVAADLIDAFGRAGFETIVLCGHPSYRPEERRSWRPLRRERNGSTTVVRVGSTGLDRASFAARLANYLSFLLLASLWAIGARRRDLVVAGSDPPLAILVGLLAARGRPLVYHLQDLHPEEALAAGWIRPGALARAWERIHRLALRRASLVVCLAEAIAERVKEKGVPADRVTVVANGAHPDPGDPDPALVERVRGDAGLLVVHAGNIGIGAPWETLGAASRRFPAGAELVCVGDGACEEEVRSWGLRTFPFQRDIASVMAAGDLQLVSLRPGFEGYAVPSKLYGALVHGRPVLAVVPRASEVARTVLRWECGVVADPTDPDDVAAKVTALYEDPALLERMAEGARAAGGEYERGAAMDRLVEESMQLGGSRS